MNLNARPPVSEMSDQEIAHELKDFEWEYIALADWARTDDQYNGGVVYLDERKLSLELEQELRASSSQLTPLAADGADSCPVCGTWWRGKDGCDECGHIRPAAKASR